MNPSKPEDADDELRPLPTFFRPPDLKPGPEQETTLLGMLGHTDWQVRVYAATQLGQHQTPEIVERLLANLSQRDFRLRRASGEALGHMGTYAADTLLQASTHRSSDVRQAALYGLRVAGAAAWPVLVEALDAKQAARRHAALDVLQVIRVPDTLPHLVACLEKKDAQTRWRAAAVLGELRQVTAVEPLLKCLDDSEAQVRWAAATALGAIGDDRALAGLWRRLRDPEENVAAAAAWALGEIGDTRVVSDLRLLVDSAPAALQRAAVLALGRIGGPASLAALIPLRTSPNPLLRRLITEALVLLGGSEGAEALIPLLYDTDEEVAGAAEEAVIGLGLVAEPGLRAALRTATPEQRPILETALQHLPPDRRARAA